MEILTYVLEGAMEHQDSLGNRTGTYPGDAQMMSAGAGITHREFNFSETNPVYFPQIWMISDPEELGKKR
ncbi:pirin family protein [Trichocoleus sp. ST-U3]|uniref:pirin family protein n=1 Tax=Coleofasciculus sp. FACHB-542 TaxID=2692787 RepID=UPI0018EF54B4|nr:pirin family protein [Coleofasciculus sp. FACHB-542]